jgi:hypothetical protein
MLPTTIFLFLSSVRRSKDAWRLPYLLTRPPFRPANSMLPVSFRQHAAFSRRTGSAVLLHGSGLRSGDFNLNHVPAYGQMNLGMSRENPDARREADHRSLRYSQCVRFDLLHSRWLGHRRVRAAIWPASWVLHSATSSFWLRSRGSWRAAAGSGNEFVDEKKIDEKQNDDDAQN